MTHLSRNSWSSVPLPIPPLPSPFTGADTPPKPPLAAHAHISSPALQQYPFTVHRACPWELTVIAKRGHLALPTLSQCLWSVVGGGADDCPRLGRYLVPEFEDAAFGPRASAVHTRLQEELLSSRDSTFVLSAIPKQMEVIAMLRHINSELKVCGPP